MEFEDTLQLSFGHNLILGNIPSSINLSQACNKLEQDLLRGIDNSQLESFGLFDSNQSNYNTYYPDVKPEDFTPKEDEFIYPIFRALSQVIVHKEYNPVDFSIGDVLKKSMILLKGATVNADHERAIGNALGAVQDVSWQEAYKMPSGITMPAGINAKFKIDGKSHPRVARAIMMNPPAIHSTSVSVTFMWEKSHPNLSNEDFFGRLGAYDKDGKMIRRIATRIKNYDEISLVHHGADPFAQKKDGNGNIILPRWADNQYNAKLAKKMNANPAYFFFDFKSDILQNSQNTIPPKNINNNSNHQSEKMNRQLLLTLATIIQLDSTNWGEDVGEAEISLVQEGVANIVNQLATAKQTIANLTTANTGLVAIKAQYEQEKTTFARAVELETFQKNVTKNLREDTVKNYTLLNPNAKEDDIMLSLINNASYETLFALNSTYAKQVDEKFPMTCKTCNGHDISRASSIANSGDQSEKQFSKSTLLKKVKSKRPFINMFEQEEDNK